MPDLHPLYALADLPIANVRVVLRLIRQGAGRATWHYVANRYAQPDMPLVPDCMTILKALTKQGFVVTAEPDAKSGGMARYSLTAAGTAWYEAPLIAGPLDEQALETILIAASNGWSQTMRAWIELVKRDVPLSGPVAQTLNVDPEHAARLLSGALLLAPAERETIVAAVMHHASPLVRVAALELLSPARVDHPGLTQPLVSTAALDGALRVGLDDESLDVRRAAAMLCFAGERGASHSERLLALTLEANGQLRYWALLALGSARDAASLLRLEERTIPESTLDALGAFGGLAQRPDGLRRWSSMFATADADLFAKGCYALSTFMRDLDDVTLQRLGKDRRPGVAEALAAYRTRQRGSAT